MNLLEKPLPRLSLKPDVVSSEFFDRCEQVASVHNYRVDRRKLFAGEGTDQLNLHLREQPDGLMLRMVVIPSDVKRIVCDVVAYWHSNPLTYDEYVAVASVAFAKLFKDYASTFGRRLFLGVGHKAAIWDWDPSTVNCQQLQYAYDKFQEAFRALAVGSGDARSRLGSAFLILHVVRPTELPQPLQSHFSWVIHQISWREARWRGEGTVGATLAQMKRSTAAKIAERILAIYDALNQLCPGNRI